MPKTVFDIGEKAGFLTIISELPKDSRSMRIYLVRCQCGTEKIVAGRSLRPGATLSCGCYSRQTGSLKHGDTRGSPTTEWTCWAGMKKRCLSSSQPNFRNYGGRGISVCDRWLESFEEFLSDMGRKPSASHSIDRIDVNGNYEPGNCRWATAQEQANNKRHPSYTR